MSTFILVFCVSLALVLAITLLLKDEYFLGGVVFFMTAIITSYVIDYNSDEGVATRAKKEEEKAKQEQEELQPRAIRQVDNCTVYAFKDLSRWHYFTKCTGASATTESTYSVPCGKSHCTKTEVISN